MFEVSLFVVLVALGLPGVLALVMCLTHRIRLERLEEVPMRKDVFPHDIWALRDAIFVVLAIAAKETPVLDLDAFYRVDLLRVPLKDAARDLSLTVQETRERVERVREILDTKRIRRSF